MGQPMSVTLLFWEVSSILLKDGCDEFPMN